MTVARTLFRASFYTVLALVSMLQAASFLNIKVHAAEAASHFAAGTKPRLLDPPLFGPNVRANSDATAYGQHEPSLAVSRTHPETVIVASKDYRNGNVKQVWIDVSTDGGATWPVDRQLQIPGIPTDLNNQSDPVVVARDDGRIYVVCLGVREPNRDRGGVFITWTDDDGATWQNPSVPVYYPDNTLDDKEWLAIDNNPASPYYHRMYITYSPGAAYVAEQHSTDGGLTWTNRQTLSGTSTEYAYPVVGPDGTAYNFMMRGWGGGNTGTIQVTKSTNGGVTWSSPSTVSLAYQPSSPIRNGDLFRFFSILSAAADPTNGNLYVAWTDSRNFSSNGTDILYVKSSDAGTSWSAPQRLSHDPAGVVRDHITPAITVDGVGRLHAFWLDRRLDPANHLFDSWYSASTDGGATWEADTRVSTVSQDLNVGLPPGSGNAAGDYWGLDAVGSLVYTAWNDTRSGDQDILVSRGVRGAQTATPTPTVGPPSGTATAYASATATRTVSASPTACLLAFTDVPPASTFYGYIRCLACRGIVSGYPCGGPGEPCDANNSPYFRPGNNVTRGQIAKIVSNAAGFNEPAGNQVYEDVPPGNAFYLFINRLSNRGYMGGYPCGGTNPETGEQEPCVQPGNRPYFRPSNVSSRGQLAKIVSNAAGFSDSPGTQTFEDVGATHPFYVWIERLSIRSVVGGYPCGGINPETGQTETCGAQSRPYFRPYNHVTRGQTAKVVQLALIPGCQTPAAAPFR